MVAGLVMLFLSSFNLFNFSTSSLNTWIDRVRRLSAPLAPRSTRVVASASPRATVTPVWHTSRARAALSTPTTPTTTSRSTSRPVPPSFPNRPLTATGVAMHARAGFPNSGYATTLLGGTGTRIESLTASSTENAGFRFPRQAEGFGYYLDLRRGIITVMFNGYVWASPFPWADNHLPRITVPPQCPVPRPGIIVHGRQFVRRTPSNVPAMPIFPDISSQVATQDRLDALQRYTRVPPSNFSVSDDSFPILRRIDIYPN